MHGNRSARIVNLNYPLIEQNANTNHNARNDSDDYGGGRRDKRARRRDRNQASQHSVTSHRDVRLAERIYQKNIAAAEPATAARLVFTAITEMRRSERPKGRTGIESHPTEQQNESTGNHKDQVVRGKGSGLCHLVHTCQYADPG